MAKKSKTEETNAPVRCDCDIIHEDSVRHAKADMLEGQMYEDLASLLKHFGDPTRVRILHVLAKRELCVCDLAALLDLTKSAISHQLKALRLSEDAAKMRRQHRKTLHIVKVMPEHILKQRKLP